jgi:hypothetical protein
LEEALDLLISLGFHPAGLGTSLLRKLSMGNGMGSTNNLWEMKDPTQPQIMFLSALQFRLVPPRALTILVLQFKVIPVTLGSLLFLVVPYLMQL